VAIRLLLHPQLGMSARPMERSCLAGPDTAATRESFLHAEVANAPATAALQQQLAELRRVPPARHR
jgi:hypothetical protein